MELAVRRRGECFPYCRAALVCRACLCVQAHLPKRARRQVAVNAERVGGGSATVIQSQRLKLQAKMKADFLAAAERVGLWAEPSRSPEKPKAIFEARLKGAAMMDVVADIRPFNDPVPPDLHHLDLVTFLFFYHDTTYMNVD